MGVEKDLYVLSSRPPDQPKIPFPEKEREFILKDRLPVFLFCSIKPVFFEKKFDDFILKHIEISEERMTLSFLCSDGRYINLTLMRKKDCVEGLFRLSYESTGQNDNYYMDRVNRFNELFKNKIKKLKRACHDCIYGPKYNLTKECSDEYQQYEKLDD